MLDLNGSGMIDPMVSYRVIEFSDLKTEGYGLPAGLRIGGFGKNFGGALEFSFYTQRVVKQKTQVSLNGGTARDFSIQNNDLMRLDSFGISGDLMFRFSDKMIQPYLGVGLGFAINSFYSPGISGYTGTVFKKPLQDLELGVMFRMPVGVRVAIARGTDLFAEYRMVTNLSSFDRDIKDETDTLSMTTGFFIFGLSGRF
jgi:hypothetical protein